MFVFWPLFKKQSIQMHVMIWAGLIQKKAEKT
jgi:hypothetical protein